MNMHIFRSTRLGRSYVFTIYSVCTLSIVLQCQFVLSESWIRRDGHDIVQIVKREDAQPAVTNNPSDGSGVQTSPASVKADINKITSKPGSPENKDPPEESKNCTAGNANSTECSISKTTEAYKSFIQEAAENKGMLLRTLYVTLGVTCLVVVYFVARTVWLRRKRTKSRKYGIIAQHGDQRDMEMEPLGDGNDDDEDYTVFEVNGKKK